MGRCGVALPVQLIVQSAAVNELVMQLARGCNTLTRVKASACLRHGTACASLTAEKAPMVGVESASYQPRRRNHHAGPRLTVHLLAALAATASHHDSRPPDRHRYPRTDLPPKTVRRRGG
jgi:hypothetical protein